MKKRYWKICLSCGKTVGNVNKDGECRECVRERKELDAEWMNEWELDNLKRHLKGGME